MNAQVPIIHYDQTEAADAYRAYLGILAHQKLDPSLRNNPAWAKLRDAAYAQFYCAFEVLL